MSGVFAGLQLLRAGFVVICGARTRLLWDDLPGSDRHL